MMGGDGGDRPLPVVELHVHEENQLPAGFDLDRIKSICPRALGEVSELMKPGAPLAALEAIEVPLVSDAMIAQAHQAFMAICGATDVIRFGHGEIVISTDTAAVQGAENGNSAERETALYVVHGLLHLAGYADKSEAEFGEMARLQDRVLDLVWES